MTQELKELIEKVIGKEDGLPGLKVSEVKESPCTKPGDNFLSAVSVAEVVGTLPGGAPYSNTIFIKRPLNNPMFKELYQMDQAFSNEATVYLKLLPLFDKSMPFARCYHADQDLVILEDLGKSGYKMADRIKGFDLKTAKDVIKTLSIYHASSYLANLKHKDDFLNVCRQLKPIGLNRSATSAMLKEMFHRLYTCLEKSKEVKKELLKDLKPLGESLPESMKQLRKPKMVELLIHGDFWMNNILTCREARDSVRFVDLQACALASPAVDVWTFLYTSLEPEVFEYSLQDLVETYCRSLTEELSNLKVAPEQCPSLTELAEELMSKELYGLLMAMVYLPARALVSDAVPDLESISKENTMKEENSEGEPLYNGLNNMFVNLAKVCDKRGIFQK